MASWGFRLLLALFLVLALAWFFRPSKKQGPPAPEKPGYQNVEAFLSLCKEILSEPGAKADANICPSVREFFFSSDAASAELRLDAFGAPALPSDAVTQMRLYQDPRVFVASGYCYFSSRGWIDENMTPGLFGKFVVGFSVVAGETTEYAKWIATPAGLACKKLVEKETGEAVPDFADVLRDKRAWVALNPVALLHGKAKLEEITKEAALTLNHERIHVLQGVCPEFQEWSALDWEAVKEPERAKIRAQHPSYAWEDPEIGAREYVAFRFEKNPREILKYLGGCAL